jgi:hypothetical protein
MLRGPRNWLLVAGCRLLVVGSRIKGCVTPPLLLLLPPATNNQQPATIKGHWVFL